VSGTSGFHRKAVVLLGYFFYTRARHPTMEVRTTYLLMCWRDLYCQPGALLQLVKRLLYQAKVVLISIYINRQQRLSIDPIEPKATGC